MGQMRALIAGRRRGKRETGIPDGGSDRSRIVEKRALGRGNDSAGAHLSLRLRLALRLRLPSFFASTAAVLLLPLALPRHPRIPRTCFRPSV